MLKSVVFGLCVPVVVALLTAASGCTVTTNGTDTPDASSGGDGATPSTGVLGFAPSNIDVSQLDFSNVGDLVVSDAAGKTWETDHGLLGSDNSGTYNYKEIKQTNGLTLGVFTVKSITIAPNVTVGVEGPDALVIVALDTIDIQGTLAGNTQSSPFRLGPGSLQGQQGDSQGLGNGGGGSGNGSTSGAGAGFCAVGGSGASTVGTAGSAQGGSMYGTPSLVPLVAGSQGGVGNGLGGPGGGAIQLVAANAITVSGAITVGGAGGGNGGVFDDGQSQNSGGGGSGGALLLEAPQITVNGKIAANGGGGQGDGAYGADGDISSDPAKGGNDNMHMSLGGDGAAGDDVEGKAGSDAPQTSAGGGGGAVGRIRFNTTSGSATIAGLVSPSLSTQCVSQGTLGQ